MDILWVQILILIHKMADYIDFSVNTEQDHFKKNVCQKSFIKSLYYNLTMSTCTGPGLVIVEPTSY